MLRITRLVQIVVLLSLVVIMAACGGKTDPCKNPASPGCGSSKPSVGPSGPITIQPGQTATFTVQNGRTPYAWSLPNGGGTLLECGSGSDSCTVKAGDQPGTYQVSVNAGGTQLSGLFTVPAGTQVTLRFTNGLTGAPVAGASVQVIGGPFTITNGSGEATVTVYASSFSFEASLTGYLTRKASYAGGDGTYPLWALSNGVSEDMVKQMVYGDQSGPNNPGLRSLLRLASPAISLVLDPALAADPAVVTAHRNAAATLQAATNGQIQVSVVTDGNALPGTVPVRVSVDPSLVGQYAAVTSLTATGNAIQSGAVRYQSQEVAAREFTTKHEVGHVPGWCHHSSRGLLGTGGTGMDFTPAEKANMLMTLLRQAGNSFPDTAPSLSAASSTGAVRVIEIQ